MAPEIIARLRKLVKRSYKKTFDQPLTDDILKKTSSKPVFGEELARNDP
jgi:hypothetical protein